MVTKLPEGWIDMSSELPHINNECPACQHIWMDKVKAAGKCPSCAAEYTMEGYQVPGGEITISWSFPVYFAIAKLMEPHGFRLRDNGDLVRDSSGCCFPRASLLKYKSVVDFQLDWGYA